MSWEVQGEQQQVLVPELGWIADWPCSWDCLRAQVQEQQTRCSWCESDGRCLEQDHKQEIEHRRVVLDEHVKVLSAMTGLDAGSYWIVDLLHGHSLEP